MLMLLFCSCDIFSPKQSNMNNFLVINNKLIDIEKKLISIDSLFTSLDSTITEDVSIIDQSLSNITNLLFLTLDNDSTSSNYNLYEKDIDVEKIFYENFMIKNIRFKTCVLEEKATKALASYFLSDTITVFYEKLEFDYIVYEINNFEKYIEILSLNTEKTFKIILKDK